MKDNFNKNTRKHRFLWFFMFLLTGVLSLGLFEFLSIFFVPTWPARDLRMYRISGPKYNSWGMQDKERSIQKEKGKYRILFIGDSFVDGYSIENPISIVTEKKLHEQGKKEIEIINLGDGGADPRLYYYRLKKVGLKLSPDEVYVFLYADNDWLFPIYYHKQTEHHPYHYIYPSTVKQNWLALFVNDPPKPSLLGTIAPRLNWSLTNLYRHVLPASIKQIIQTTKKIFEKEVEKPKTLQKIIHMPPEERIQELTKYIHTKNIYPNLKPSKIQSLLTHLPDSFWKIFGPKEDKRDQETPFDRFYKYFIVSKINPVSIKKAAPEHLKKINAQKF